MEISVEKIFAERFKDLRIEKDLSSIKLGKALSVNDTTILRWEKGLMVPNIINLYKIATYFGVSADYLIGLEN